MNSKVIDISDRYRPPQVHQTAKRPRLTRRQKDIIASIFIVLSFASAAYFGPVIEVEYHCDRPNCN